MYNSLIDFEDASGPVYRPSSLDQSPEHIGLDRESRHTQASQYTSYQRDLVVVDDAFNSDSQHRMTRDSQRPYNTDRDMPIRKHRGGSTDIKYELPHDSKPPKYQRHQQDNNRDDSRHHRPYQRPSQRSRGHRSSGSESSSGSSSVRTKRVEHKHSSTKRPSHIVTPPKPHRGRSHRSTTESRSPSTDRRGKTGHGTRDRRNRRKSSSDSSSRSPDQRRQTRRNRRKDIEARRFNGKDSVDDYLVQFELTAKHNQWTDEQKATALLCALDGPARSILADFDDPSRVEYRKIRRSLQKRFGATEQTEVHELALSSLRLTRGQSIRELASEVNRLTRKAYPDLSSMQRERFAIKALLQSIPDRDVVFYIRDKDPDTIEEACTLHERYEALLHNRRPPVAVKGVSMDDNTTADPQLQATRREIDQLRTDTLEQFKALTSAISKLGTVKPQVPSQATTDQPNSFDLRGAPRFPCPQCKLPGHWKIDCPQLQSNPRRSNSRAERCLECQGVGHRWRNCPQLQSENGRGSTSAPNSRPTKPAPRN